MENARVYHDKDKCGLCATGKWAATLDCRESVLGETCAHAGCDTPSLASQHGRDAGPDGMPVGLVWKSWCADHVDPAFPCETVTKTTIRHAAV